MAAPGRWYLEAMHTGLRERRPRVVLSLFFAAAFVLWCAGLSPVAAQDASDTAAGGVVVLPVEGIIDLGLAGFVDRSVSAAEAAHASLLVVDIETFGGRVDAAVKIRDRLLGTPVRSVAYVNPRAISAGALIAMACDEIYMAPGGTIGAASPVSIDPTGESKGLGEKEVSYVRTEFRATAERNGYPPLIAEAMVDKDATVAVFTLADTVRVVTVDEIERVATELGLTAADAKTYSAAGKLLSMTTQDALAVRLAAGQASTLEELLETLQVAGSRVTRLQTTWSEDLVRILTHPILSGLLLSLGMVGLFIELRAPGWGLPGTLGVIALVLFFGAQHLVGLAQVEDVLLIGIGVGLLLVEAFVLPGFGVAGVTGIICLLLGMYLALVDAPIPRYSWDFEQLNTAGITFGTGMLGTMVLFGIALRYLPRTTFGRSFMLATELGTDIGYTGVKMEAMPDIGARGTAYTVLRPSGRVRIGDRLVDAQTDGGFIEQGTAVQVIQILGNAVVVEAVAAEAAPEE